MSRINRSIQKSEQKVAQGSIYDVSNRQNVPVEAVMADAQAVVFLDRSGSMSHYINEDQYDPFAYNRPNPGGNTRFEDANKALEGIQRRYDGKIILIPFSTFPELQLNGVPRPPDGGTDVAAALEMGKQFDGLGMKFVLISDGEPNSDVAAIEVAKTYEDPIDTIFIGADKDIRGIDFLNRLSAATRGQALGKIDVEKLEGATVKLLEGR